MDVLRDMMAVFAKFEAVCATHNLSFWIDWGTMLGALRHGGIIPWDYDMDVCMFSDDYAKLVALFQAGGRDGLVLSPDYYDDPSGCCFVMASNRDERAGIDVVAYDMSPDGKRIVTRMSEKTLREYSTPGVPDVYNLVATDALPMRRILLSGSLVFCPKNAEERCALMYGDWKSFPPDADVDAWPAHVLAPPATAWPLDSGAALPDDGTDHPQHTVLATERRDEEKSTGKQEDLTLCTLFEDLVTQDGAKLWGKVSVCNMPHPAIQTVTLPACVRWGAGTRVS